MSRRPAGATLACFAALLLLRAPALAAENDYLPDNLSWNGLSELADLAQGMQLRVELVAELDWGTLPARSTLLVIYPLAAVDPVLLTAFLGRGGRALIADDFGQAGLLLERLGIHRLEPSQLGAARHHDGNRNLPVATRGPASHPLNAGVREVITNHPTAFRSALPTLLGFQADRQVLVAARVGHGTLVALSDPSVLINGMLRFEGNMTLATNLLRNLRPAEGNSLYLLTGEFRVRARKRTTTKAAPADSVGRFLTEYNEFLGSFNDLALTPPALRTLAFLAGCLSLVALLVLLPLPRRDPDGHWLRPQGTPRLDYEEQVQRLGRGAGSALRAGIVLREELEVILTDKLAAPGPVFTIHPGWVVRQVRERWGAPAAELAERLITALRQLPEEQLGHERLSRFRAAELARLHELGRQLLELLREEPGGTTGDSPPPRTAPRG